MADWIDDDWDSSSPIGSPSSSLPQSIREVLESVRAECSAGKFGAYCIGKPTKMMETDSPREEQLNSHHERTMELDDMKKMSVEPHVKATCHVEAQHSQGTATKMIPQDVAVSIQSNLDTNAANTISSLQNVVEQGRKIPDVTLAGSTQTQIGSTKQGLKSAPATGGPIARNLAPEDLLRLKKVNLNMIGNLPDYQNTKDAPWIKIDCQTKTPSLNNVISTAEYQKMSSKEIESFANLRLKKITQNSTLAEKNIQDQVSQKGFPIQKQVLQICETIELSDDDDDKEEGQSRVQPHANYIEISDDSLSVEHESDKVANQIDEQGKTTKLEEGNTDDVDEMQADYWMLDNKWNMGVRNTISKTKSKENLSSDESGTSIQSKRSNDSLTHTLSGVFQEGKKPQIYQKAGEFHYNKSYQDDANLEWTDKSEENNASKVPKMEETDSDIGHDSNDETLHNTLKEKYINMNFSKVMTPIIKKEYPDWEPMCEEIEEFARTSPMQEGKKMQIFDDQQAIDRNVIHRNTNIGETKKDELGQGTRKNSVTIWRQELLLSDFNLIYGSLRAVLMRNLSKEDRHRLIQTMIATMGEIEEVTMGEGNPTQMSIRYGTPEPNAGYFIEDAIKKEGIESDSATEEEKVPFSSKLEVYGEENRQEPAAHGRRQHTRQAFETALNLKRIKCLMKVGSDGRLVCLICKRSGIPPRRVCRACSAMAYRVEKNYSIGSPLPICNHSDYSGGVKCKSCRFRRFCFMSMTETDTRVRAVNSKMCQICKQYSYSTRGWKCTKCYYFILKLKRRNGPVPTCKHNGEYPDTCYGCRCRCLQELWPKYEPDRKYPLPFVKPE